MRIKKLEIVGFKSFKDRTVIHFDAGITGVVGPNGCGKSNIVDALVWVMGEMSAKHLRGSSMEDVIFAGAEGYAPLGLAEVSLTLENDGGPFPAKYARFSEIMVTRRLHRNGESEYLINKEPARLRDTQEIFMDTGAGSKGFSIIEQGAIGKIITAKPEDRRTLIEEAAGITKFKVRKRESQRKLTQTDQNLVRLQDIIGEQKRQLDSLQRQAQRAERYRNLKNDIRNKELWVTSKAFLELRGDIEQAQKGYIQAQDCDTSVTTEISEMESELAEMKLEVLERENDVEALQVKRQKVQEQSQLLENEIRELRFEIEQARRNKEMTGNILEQYQARQRALENEKKTYEERESQLAHISSDLDQKYVVSNEKYQTVQRRVLEADEELTQTRREMLAVSQSESHMNAKLLSVQTQIEDVGIKAENSRSVLAELNSKSAGFEERQAKVSAALESEKQMQLEVARDVETIQTNLVVLKDQFEEKRVEVESFKDALNEVSSRLYGLENLHANFEGFEDGVKSVMLWQRQRLESQDVADGDISESQYQPMVEIVEVPQEYELAMEAALGSRLQMLLAQDSQSALSAVEYLKEKKSGRSSFVALDMSSGLESDSWDQTNLLKEKGFKALLTDVVVVPASFQKQVSSFLRDVVVVDNIRNAMALRKDYSNLSFVTLDGDTLTNEGILTGGTNENVESGVLKRRREIKELSIRREEFAGKLSLAQIVLKKIEAKIKSLSSDYESSKNRQNEKEISVAELKKDLERADNELNNARVALRKQQEESSRDENQLLVLREREEEIQESIEETREKRIDLESQVETLTEELRNARLGIDSLQMEVTELKVESAAKKQELEGIRHQLKMVSNSLFDVNQNLSQMSEESEKSTESLSLNSLKVEEQKLQLERVISELQVIHENLKLATNSYEEIAAQESDLSDKLSVALHSINENKARLNEAQLKLEQYRMKERYLLDQIFERYQLNLAEESSKFADIEGDLATTEAELEDLKDKLKRIGEVNLSAIEEYDELSERYRFLSQQHQDLTEAKESLRKVIDRINRICSRRFRDTFELVNERFVKVFPVLFGGGEARLVMVEDLEHGEQGIDIVAKPPGKKLQNVGLLSGGEKALTAVSLIFSIFLVKPSPYCLLDEVDAPLDDANVYRFNDLVGEMAKRSQIIVVTHNKHTMRVADKLYGVTMEEKGVSKMVSVNLNEAERVAEV
ncbi:MAG: chromosome segregation protein SMC [Bdellovibrionales bacterium]|nr:chromosome segregation protein SMC [Bdellovibrionales bacterium]